MEVRPHLAAGWKAVRREHRQHGAVALSRVHDRAVTVADVDTGRRDMSPSEGDMSSGEEDVSRLSQPAIFRPPP